MVDSVCLNPWFEFGLSCGCNNFGIIYFVTCLWALFVISDLRGLSETPAVPSSCIVSPYFPSKWLEGRFGRACSASFGVDDFNVYCGVENRLFDRETAYQALYTSLGS
jgi:hypothetical protein